MHRLKQEYIHELVINSKLVLSNLHSTGLAWMSTWSHNNSLFLAILDRISGRSAELGICWAHASVEKLWVFSNIEVCSLLCSSFLERILGEVKPPNRASLAIITFLCTFSWILACSGEHVVSYTESGELSDVKNGDFEAVVKRVRSIKNVLF